MAANETNESTVRVTFTTAEADLQLPEECRQLFVPGTTGRYGLSRILNSETMLGVDHPVPLDFLIGGEILRGTVAEHAARLGLAAHEATIDVEYVRALVPPRFDRSFEHPEWVSAVDVLSSSRSRPANGGTTEGDATTVAAGAATSVDERILSASFDGLLRMWTADGTCIATSPGATAGGHKLPIKAAAFISPTSVASAGMDRTVRVWNYSEKDRALAADAVANADANADADDGPPNNNPVGAFKPTLLLSGHMHPITTLRARGDKARLLTADAGGAIALWTSTKSAAPLATAGLANGDTTQNNKGNNDSEDNTQSVKRRKISSGGSPYAPVRGPLSLRVYHSGAAVADFHHASHTVAYSGGFSDHLVRTLDLVTGTSVSSVQLTASPTALLSLAGPSVSPIVAVGTSSRRIVLVDPRVDVLEGATRTSVLTLKGHTNWISRIVQCPTRETTIASASHDGTIMVWDLRGKGPLNEARHHSNSWLNPEGGEDTGPVTRPVYVIDREGLPKLDGVVKRPLGGEGVKVFDMVWDKDWGIVSGGEDRKVQVDRWDAGGPEMNDRSA